ncbi:MAG: PQQ-like beta-propeller repeat protein [Anaerolineales bacterium]|nr:PQQ-like beta-propeller repeat protein [Anaerolineales bacterium]
MKLRNLSWLALFLIMSTGILSGCTGSTTVASSWPGLFVDQDTAYVAYNTQVYAVNTMNGNEIWRFPEEANAKTTFYAPPVLTSDNQLIAGSYNFELYSLNPSNGTEKWSFTNPKNRFIGSPLLTEAGIFASNSDNTLYALDLQGNLLWSYEVGGEIWAQPVMDPDGTKLYLSSLDHYLYAVSSDGQLIWKTKQSLGGAIVGSPAIGSNNTLYVGSFGSKMFAINADNGEILWSFPTEAWVWSGPVCKDNVLYFGDLNNAFYALDAENGKSLWQYPTDGPVVGTPLVTEDTIYFGTEIGTLYSLDFQGNLNWKKTIDAKIYQSPVRSGDLLLLAPVAKENILIAFDLNGNQKWVFTPAKK